MWLLRRLALLLLPAAAIAAAAPAHAQAVPGLTVQACYWQPACDYAATVFGTAQVDTPVFLISNIGTKTATNIRFKMFAFAPLGLPGDTFVIKRLKPGQSIVVAGGIADGHGHPALGIWASPTDWSETQRNSDNVTFVVNATVNGAAVSSGRFRAGDSSGPSTDGTVTRINFLGSGGRNANFDADTCNGGCFGPKVIATVDY